MRNVKGLLVTMSLSVAAGSAMAEQPVKAEAAAPVIQGKFKRMQGESVQGEYIVILKDQAGPASAGVAAAGHELTQRFGVEVLHQYESAVRALHIRATEAQALALAEHPRVALVEENGVVTLSGDTTQTDVAAWNLDRIDQSSRQLNTTFKYPEEAGQGVDIFIVDSGVNAYHTEFSPDGWTSKVDTLFNYFASTGTGDGDEAPNGHGTFVAGILVGETWGVAKKASLHSVKVMNSGGLVTNDAVVGGLNFISSWADSHPSAKIVVNISLNSNNNYSFDAAASTLANKPNVVVVTSAGNSKVESATQPGTYEGTDACKVSPNAANAKIIVVGATDRNDMRMNNSATYQAAGLYSNFGPCVDIFAPGVDIISANKNGSTALGTGTSFSAPHVAGVAALMMSKTSGASTPASVQQDIINDSNPGQISNPGTGSPNRLLYLRPFVPQITNGVTTYVSGPTGSITTYVLRNVPAGVALTFSSSGGTGDADMYVRRGAVPDTYTYDCRPLRAGNNETCSFTNVQGGDWYVQLRGYQTFSSVALKGQY